MSGVIARREQDKVEFVGDGARGRVFQHRDRAEGAGAHDWRCVRRQSISDRRRVTVITELPCWCLGGVGWGMGCGVGGVAGFPALSRTAVTGSAGSVLWATSVCLLAIENDDRCGDWSWPAARGGRGRGRWLRRWTDGAAASVAMTCDGPCPPRAAGSGCCWAWRAGLVGVGADPGGFYVAVGEGVAGFVGEIDFVGGHLQAAVFDAGTLLADAATRLRLRIRRGRPRRGRGWAG